MNWPPVGQPDAPPAPQRAAAAQVGTLLRRVQTAIETLYDISLDVDVLDYLIDATTRARLPGAAPEVPEQLFVRGQPLACGSAEAETLELALYLDADLLQALAADDPFTALHRGNVEAFCVVVEGVSHLIFLAWRLGHGLDVSALELELQAEMDKFCLAILLATKQGARVSNVTASWLWRQLFVAFELAPHLGVTQRQRYLTASQAAGRITRGMWPLSAVADGPLEAAASVPHVTEQQRLRQRQQVRELLRRARQWCRRSLADKLRAA